MPSAIAVMRISGSGADAALAALTTRPLPAPRRAAVRRLAVDGELLDEALVLRFPGPHTATGENLVELHLHGGRATVAAVTAALGQLPRLRHAEPGEFTRRAFENGRIDLSAAEGLADLLRAETEAQRRSALAIAGGGLARKVDALRVKLLEASARIEAAIDFADEDDVQPWPERAPVLVALAATIGALLSSPPAERLRDGVRVVIAGPPNAGKSTMLNRLADREAAIVSSVAGTTRDVIEAPVVLGGVAMILTDTAGLRPQTSDSIEAIGIARAEATIDAADIILWLGDPAEVPNHPNILPIHAKVDIDAASGDARLAVSALTGQGIDALISRIVAMAQALLPAPDSIALNLRQQICLAEVVGEIRAAAVADDLLIAAEHLRIARMALDRLSGRAGVEDMLDALFGAFCIGK